MFKFCIAAAVALGLTSVAAAKPAVPTIAQLAAFPKVTGFNLSPDGTKIAALEARGEERVILVWRTDGLDKPPTVIGSSQMKIQSAVFVKNDVLAVSLWQPLDVRTEVVTKRFIGKLFLTDPDGKNWREPLPLPRAASVDEQAAQARTSPTVLSSLPNDPDDILVVNNVGVTAGDVYRINVHTGRAERVQRREERVSGYSVDLEGSIRARSKARTDSDGAYIATEFRNPKSGVWEEHFRSYVKNRDQTEVVGFAADPNIAFILSNVGRDKAAVYEYDVAARAKKDVVFQHKYFDAAGIDIFPFKGPLFGEIFGLTYAGPRGDDTQWVTPEFEALDKAIRAALGVVKQPITFVDPATGDSAKTNYDTDLYYDIVDYTPDLKSVVVRLEGVNQPAAYYLLRNGELSLLAKTYPDLDAAAFGKTRLVYYKARDGLDIPGLLTTPDTDLCGPGPWRTVIHPHGGPWARDNLRFDGFMWIPLMASRCMAVLRPQYRGSEGWGRKLWTAGDAQWGQKMQDDKDDGANWLIAQGIAKPGHIAMFGFSYGGYAAFAAAVRPNGIYKCAIAGAGVSDIRRIWKDFYTNPFFAEAQGPTVDGMTPLDFADKIKIPIMVYHGERDQTVPIEQSEWFVAKAKKSDQPVEYHQLADFAHGPAWTRAIDAEQLTYIDNYFSKGCGGGGL